MKSFILLAMKVHPCFAFALLSMCLLKSISEIGVVTASPEAGSSHVKIDLAFFGWFWLIVESKNILLLRRPLHANSSVAEVKKEHVEAFACESFYLLLLFFYRLLLFFYLLSCFYLLLLSFFSCRLRLIGSSTVQSYLPDNNILHIFILHAQVTKMGITPSSHN